MGCFFRPPLFQVASLYPGFLCIPTSLSSYPPLFLYLCGITGALRFSPEIRSSAVWPISLPSLLLSSFALSLTFFNSLSVLTPPSPSHPDLSQPTTFPLIICAYSRAANDLLGKANWFQPFPPVLPFLLVLPVLGCRWSGGIFRVNLGLNFATHLVQSPHCDNNSYISSGS